MSDLIEALGAARVLAPAGSLPQAADRLDLELPLQSYEVALDVDTLALDSTSFRQLLEAAGGDTARVGDAILEIVATRGKMHNPVTGSGGILTGTVTAVGAEYPDPPALGTQVVSLASLTLTPLALEAVTGVDPGSPHVAVTGTAYLPSSVPVCELPAGIDRDAAIAALDVCNSASQTRDLIDDSTRTVLVLGGGHGGLMAMAAARARLAPGGRIALIDSDPAICARAERLGLCDVSLAADLRDAVGSYRALSGAGVPRADLTIVVVNARDCEAAALLMTAEHGTVLFFSMATDFTTAALGSECMASGARMLIGSGYIADRGAYGIELLAADPDLQAALAGRA
jgi:L-erythro-3,5-diaminohexanoate dehydrogenase